MGRTGLDVPVARLRRIGGDAKGHHSALRCQACARANGRLESRSAGDHVVGRHHQQNRIFIVFYSKQ